MATKTITIEIPADEADLLAEHAEETNSSISWWIRAACSHSGYYSPLGAVPSDLPQPSDDDDEDAE